MWPSPEKGEQEKNEKGERRAERAFRPAFPWESALIAVTLGMGVGDIPPTLPIRLTPDGYRATRGFILFVADYRCCQLHTLHAHTPH